MRVSVLGVLRVLLCVSSVAFAASDGSAIDGTWLTNDGSSSVRIAESGGAYEGKVVWLREPAFASDDSQGMAGKPKVDRLNPDASLRGRPVMGLAVLTGLRYAGNNQWDGGTIYTPATGKSYPCRIALASDGSLKLTVGGGVFGRTLTWTRATPASGGGAP